jgi:hypothetical protein
MADDPRQFKQPEPAEAGEEEEVEDLEAPAEAKDDVAGGRGCAGCSCAATTVV